MLDGQNLTCRTCSKVSETWFGIFKHYEREKLLSDMLNECTAVKVEQQDELPQQICSICFEKLISAWDFKVMVINSDLKFRNLTVEVEPLLLKRESEDIGGGFQFVEISEVKEEILIKHEVLNGFGENYDNLDKKQYLSQTNSSNDTTKENLIVEENSSSKIICTDLSDIQSSENGYVFDENGVPLMKDGRKLSGRERESVPILCKHCDRTFTWRYYKVHVKQYLGDLPYKCDVCDKRFVQANKLRVHERIHTGERKFACDICGKTFKRSGTLKVHKGTHTEEKSHECNVCGMRFTQKPQLKAHIQRHNKDNWYVCELCGKSFNYQNSFMLHKRTHAADKIYPCSICGKKLSSIARKKVHEKRVHSEERPYVCSYCGKGFKQNTTLRRHIVIHTGERPYSCNICGKLFRQRQCLRVHMLCHTGEKPYVCNLCPAKFKLSYLLKKHMSTHSGSS